MKQDYEFLKEILLTLEEDSKHLINTNELVDKLKVDYNDPIKWDNFLGHMLILKDNNCIDCDDPDLGITIGSRGRCSYSIQYFRLTARGYEFIDILKNKGIFNKIKDFSVATALEIGKAALINIVSGSVSNN